MKQTLINTLKLAVAGASIFAIGSLMLAVSPERGEVVQEAQADIGDLFPRMATADNAFSTLMHDIGMRPRALDYNGNTIFFGARSMGDEPQSAMRELQQRFVERGINRQMHMRSLAESGMGMDLSQDKIQEMSDALYTNTKFERGPDHRPEGDTAAADFLSGEIMPIHNSPTYVSMAGIVPKKRGVELERPEEVFNVWEPNATGAIDPRDNSKGFRFIDLTRESDRTTTMTSVWADTDFDAHKLKPGYDGPGLSVDQDIPSCIGCVRTSRIASLEQERDPFTSNQFYSPMQIGEISNFYQNTMQRRGWQISESQELMHRLFEQNPALRKHEGQMLILERGEERVNLMMNDHGEYGTTITSLHERRDDE